MVEGLRNSIATSFGLQIVVTYLLGTIDSLLDVTVLQRTKAFVVVMGPDTGIEVCQQLQTYGEFVGLGLTELCHLGMYFLQRTRQVFHMVTHFMGYHVGIGKVAVSTQLLLHRSEEREVDIEFLVA